MAFNPLSVFQKNKRFWMAAILMICMVTFVFCTGRGDLGERLQNFLGRRGTAMLKINGTNYSADDMIKLRDQRKFANAYMSRSAEYAFRKLTAAIMDIDKKAAVADKDQKARQETLTRLAALRMSLAERKSRPNYFEGSLKLDDLVEFKLWQLEADRLGIRLDEGTISYLYNNEMYVLYLGSLGLDRDDQQRIVYEIRNITGRAAGDAYILRAIGEEFRVRMAQYAVLGSQPGSFFFRGGRNPNQGLTPKITQNDLPDEVRAPMTPAQLWDYFKLKRAEFDVTLLPLHVQDFVPEVKEEPTEIAKSDFFREHRNKPYDPSSPEWGLEIPQQIKIEYLIADPNSPAYTEMAKFKLAMEVLSPFAAGPMQAPIATAAHYVSAGQAHREVLEHKYIEASRRKDYGGAAFYRERDCLSPVLAFLAKEHPEAGASVIGRAFLTPTDPFGALSTYLAWGQAKQADAEVVQAAAAAELKRRAPSYALLFATSATQSPLDLAFPFFSLDRTQADLRFRAMGFVFEDYVHPLLPLEVVQKELEEMLVRETAREWAQSNIRVARRALEKDSGSKEGFKRTLAKLVPELKLTYGPPADKKNVHYNRYSVNDAKELAPLKEAFEKTVDIINFAEGRDVTPETLLKPGDFYKMFFDPTENFSAATSKYRAMPWPPKVKTNAARAWKADPDPRYIDREKLRNDPENVMGFLKHVHDQDPNKAPADFDGLFDNAEKPILFWRTEVVEPQRPADLAKLETDLRKKTAELETEKDPAKKAELKKDIGDLKEIQGRITEGWKLEQARDNFALPKAKSIAQEIVKTNDSVNILIREADRLRKLAKPNRSLIVLPQLSLLHPEDLGGKIDYAAVPMPKNLFEYPRSDIMAQVVGLYDLKKPIKIDWKELDEINKELFDEVFKEKKPGNFVQILTNKPRSVYYIAVVSRPPLADMRDFAEAMKMAGYDDQRYQMWLQMQQHGMRRGPWLDMFVMRAQQQEARRFRQQLVDDLKHAANYDPPSEEARKNFDDRGGSD
jgi:hypothetical protein